MSSVGGRPSSLIPEKPCRALGVPGGSTLRKTRVYETPTCRTSGGDTGPPGEKSHARTLTTTVFTAAGIGVAVAEGDAVAVGGGAGPVTVSAPPHPAAAPSAAAPQTETKSLAADMAIGRSRAFRR